MSNAAFPGGHHEWEGIEYGMNLREWYAGMIACGYQLEACALPEVEEPEEWAPTSQRTIAKYCFDMAQALVDEAMKRRGEDEK